MLKKIRTAALSALIGIGALAAVPATAQAHNVQIGSGGGQVGFGIWFGDSGHSYYRDRHYHPHHYRPHHRNRQCTVGRALNKAERMGVRRAHVQRVNHRVIKVSGRSHGRNVRIVFARSPGCPIIR